MSELGTVDRPLRVAIVGSGPSGFYAAESLVKSDLDVYVDIFERLPCPYGLVRLGVAPDHQKIKNVIKVFERIAGRSNVTFLGNVAVGQDITVDELQRFYDAIIFCSGAQTDRSLNIPGEDLSGSHTATEFVAWYNGHPDYQDRVFDLHHESAVVIGQGNVAVDVCRILAKTPDELKETDIAQHALEVLAESRIRDIYMIGRRGPVQAKFTQLEIKELGELEACTPVVDPKELELEPGSEAELNDPGNKLAPKTFPILEQFAKNDPTASGRRLHIVFRKSPVALHGTNHLESVELERNRLEGEPFRMKAVGTGETQTLPCGIFFRSVGYRGVAIPALPFDEARGVVPNVQGRVEEAGVMVPGLYVAGWIKRGPTGIIGTNKADSHETVAALLEDLPQLAPCETPSADAVFKLLQSRDVRVVSFADWQKIDAAEIERGKPAGKPREKFTSVQEMLAALATVETS